MVSFRWYCTRSPQSIGTMFEIVWSVSHIRAAVIAESYDVDPKRICRAESLFTGKKLPTLLMKMVKVKEWLIHTNDQRKKWHAEYETDACPFRDVRMYVAIVVDLHGCLIT